MQLSIFFSKTNGYNEAIYRLPSISQSVTSLNEEQTINASLFEVIKKFEFDNKRLEDDCQDYRLRIKSLQESDERNEKTIERLRKEQQTSETCQYRYRCFFNSDTGTINRFCFLRINIFNGNDR